MLHVSTQQLSLVPYFNRSADCFGTLEVTHLTLQRTGRGIVRGFRGVALAAHLGCTHEQLDLRYLVFTVYAPLMNAHDTALVITAMEPNPQTAGTHIVYFLELPREHVRPPELGMTSAFAQSPAVS